MCGSTKAARRKREITAIRAISIEFDAPEAHHRRSQPVPPSWHLEPSALVVRGDSVHAHWIVSDCPIEQFDECQGRAQQFYGSNSSSLGIQRIWRVPGFPHPLFPDQGVELRVGAGEPYSVDEFMHGLPALALEVHTPVRSTQGGSGDPVTSDQLRTILSFIDPTLDEEYARWVGIAKALWCGQIFVIGEAPDWISLTDDWCSGRLWQERTGARNLNPRHTEDSITLLASWGPRGKMAC